MISYMPNFITSSWICSTTDLEGTRLKHWLPKFAQTAKTFLKNTFASWTRWSTLTFLLQTIWTICKCKPEDLWLRKASSKETFRRSSQGFWMISKLLRWLTFYPLAKLERLPSLKYLSSEKSQLKLKKASQQQIIISGRLLMVRLHIKWLLQRRKILTRKARDCLRLRLCVKAQSLNS